MGFFGAASPKPTVVVGTAPFIMKLHGKAGRLLWDAMQQRCKCFPSCQPATVAIMFSGQVTPAYRKALFRRSSKIITTRYLDKNGRRKVCGGPDQKNTQAYPTRRALKSHSWV